MPQISVIVPIYKVEKYIHRCVDSILGQTYGDFELILVDDGSPDNCGAICDEYAAKDSRVVVIHQENGGLAAARNAGLDWVFANSDSQWIAFVDSDDWVHPSFLELMYAAAQEQKAWLVCCDFERVASETHCVAPNEIVVSCQHPRDVYIYTDGRGEGAFAWRYLYHRSLFEEIRYPIGKLWEDIFTTPRVIFRTDKLAVVHAPLYYYFTNPSGITKSKWTPRNLDVLEALEFNIAFFTQNGEKRLLKQTVKSYLSNIAFQIDCVSKSTIPDEARKRMARLLQKKVRQAIWKYRNLKLISFPKDGYIYAMAWPMLTNCRWIIQSQFHKIKALVNSNSQQCE